MLGKCGRIAGTMQNPNDHKLMLTMQVVDGIVARKTNAQPAREVFSRRGCKWKVKQPVAIVDFGFNVRLGEFENSKPYGK